MMKSAMMDAAPEPEQTTQELLEAFVQPLEQQDALYQDYTEQHRSQYKKLRQRPEEVIELVLPELLSDTEALECYSRKYVENLVTIDNYAIRFVPSLQVMEFWQ